MQLIQNSNQSLAANIVARRTRIAAEQAERAAHGGSTVAELAAQQLRQKVDRLYADRLLVELNPGSSKLQARRRAGDITWAIVLVEAALRRSASN